MFKLEPENSMPIVTSRDLPLSDSAGGNEGVIQKILNGDFQLPEFQRPFKWTSKKIQGLGASILQNHPISGILTLEVREEPQLAWVKLSGVEIPYERQHLCYQEAREDCSPPTRYILDGQQRLTSIAQLVGLNRKEDGSYVLRYLKPFDATNSLYEVFKEWWADDDRNMATMNDKLDQFDFESIIVDGKYGGDDPVTYMKTKMIPNEGRNKEFRIPLYAISTPDHWDAFQSHFSARIQDMIEDEIRRSYESEEGSEERAEHIRLQQLYAMYQNFVDRMISRIAARWQTYSIPFMEIPRAMSIHGVTKVFTKINTQGVKLTAFDLCVAHVYLDGVKLKDDWNSALEDYSDTIGHLNDPIIPLAAIALSNRVSPKSADLPEVVSAQMLRDSWDSVIEKLDQALRLLSEHCGAGIVNGKASVLAYKPMLAPLAAVLLEYEVPTDEGDGGPARRVRFENKLKNWYFSSAMTSRYGEGVDNKQVQDTESLLAWFNTEGDHTENRPEWMHTEPAQGLRTGTGAAIFKGLMSIMSQVKPKDWFTGEIVGVTTSAESSDNHHIFPSSAMKRLVARERRVTESTALKIIRQLDAASGGLAIDCAINRAWLRDSTNQRYIKDKMPSQYLPDLENEVGKEQLLARLKEQGISEGAYECMLRDDYEGFERHRVQSLLDLLYSRGYDSTPRVVEPQRHQDIEEDED